MESWRPVATLPDTKDWTDFPRRWAVLAGLTERKAVSGFLNFPSYAADVPKVIQAQERYQSGALSLWQTILS